MKRFALILFGTLLTTSAQAASPGGPFGLGLGGGTGVSGISGKYYMGSTALQGTVGRARSASTASAKTTAATGWA
ncbi:MAG: hypothetical protein ACI8S6_004511 [Myxococcota bacterium]|jgi:hypothetical protein